MAKEVCHSLWGCFTREDAGFPVLLWLPCDPEPAARLTAGTSRLVLRGDINTRLHVHGFPPRRPSTNWIATRRLCFSDGSSPPVRKVNFGAEVNGDRERSRHALPGGPGCDLSGGERLPLPAVGSPSTGTQARPPRLSTRVRGGPGEPVGQ